MTYRTYRTYMTYELSAKSYELSAVTYMTYELSAISHELFFRHLNSETLATSSKGKL